MTPLRVATAQFEPQDADKGANLQIVRDLTRRAVAEGADVVSFHECCLSGYSFVQMFSRDQMLDLAEPVPDGPTVLGLIDIAREFGVTLLAGLF
jgi:predicted amidohydrolase